MATAAYRDWVRAGRPWEICTPVEAFVAALQAAGWAGGALGTIGDEAHLQAETPQDHTPFSATGWPGSHPYPLILALDVMHSPEGGRDVAPLADYWLYEARQGRMPWLKYMTWRARRYDVRNNWSPVAAQGHWDHAHLSFRTDYARTGIGSWQVIPNGGNEMDVNERNMHVADTWRNLAILTGTDAVYQLEGEPEQRHEVNEPWLLLKRLETAVEVLLSRPYGALDPQAIASALAGNEAFIQALSVAVVEEMRAAGHNTALLLALGQAIVRGAEG